MPGKSSLFFFFSAELGLGKTEHHILYLVIPA